ncbi:zinc finger, CCHC-type containing protein [Tanacetum coccineum]
MGDANLILTLGDYSKPSHEGYRNTIELPVGNNVVPFRSDTIRLVQNKCSFHGLWFEDPNQHLNDFLKLVDSHDLDSANRERTRLCLFQFSLRDQASNWLECLPAGSITTWEDLTTHFLAQFFPPRRTAKLCNDILMFQQHQGESLSEAWTRFNVRLTMPPAANSATRMLMNLGRSLRTSPSTTIRARMTQRTSSNQYEDASKRSQTENNAKNKIKNEPIKTDAKEKGMEAPSSQPIEYYLKHRINEKLIKGLVDNHRFNDSLSGVRIGKMKGKTYTLSPKGSVYKAIL